MDQSKITIRYAKAFFTLAKERNQLDNLKQDVELISNLCTDSADFKLLLESPVVKTSQKIKLMEAIFKGKVHEISLGFLSMLTENKREVYLPSVCRNVLALFQQDQGIKNVVITSAVALDPEIIRQIKLQLESGLNARIELREQINPELIGGFILRIDDRQVDASMASQLRKIKEELLHAL